MSRPGLVSYELAAAQSLATACHVRFLKLLLVCDAESNRVRCYYCDFFGNVRQIIVGKSQLSRCSRFIGRIRARQDSRARHWTQLVDRQDVSRYWRREVQIAVLRGEQIAKAIAELKTRKDSEEQIGRFRESDQRISGHRTKGSAA